MTVVRRKPRSVATQDALLLRCVRARQAVSRVELARELDLVPSTVGSHVGRLLREGFLRESTPAARGLGRPPVRLELNPDRGRYFGVDIEAQNVMAVAVDFAQQPLRRMHRTLPARVTSERVLQTIERLLEELQEAAGGELLGIGVGVPGPADPERGVALHYRFIRDWKDVPVAARLGERFGVPVALENNLRSLALAELSCDQGKGRGLAHMVCLGIRSGIGSGVAVRGELLRGARNLAGEIGHWLCPQTEMDPGGRGSASQRLTLEDAASLTALRESAVQFAQRRSLDGEPLTVLLEASEAGDGTARELVRGAAKVHAWAAHQLALLLDPERIIVAGPLVEWPSYLRGLSEACGELGGDELRERVVPSALGAYGGALGAAALAVQQWKPAR